MIVRVIGIQTDDSTVVLFLGATNSDWAWQGGSRGRYGTSFYSSVAVAAGHAVSIRQLSVPNWCNIQHYRIRNATLYAVCADELWLCCCWHISVTWWLMSSQPALRLVCGLLLRAVLTGIRNSWCLTSVRHRFPLLNLSFRVSGFSTTNVCNTHSVILVLY